MNKIKEFFQKHEDTIREIFNVLITITLGPLIVIVIAKVFFTFIAVLTGSTMIFLTEFFSKLSH